jgi:hypothetical protein
MAKMSHNFLTHYLPVVEGQIPILLILREMYAPKSLNTYYASIRCGNFTSKS